MKEIVFNVFCSGIYETKLIVNDDFCGDNLDKMSNEELEKIRNYICDHLNETNIGEIEWIADIDVDTDDIKMVYKINN